MLAERIESLRNRISSRWAYSDRSRPTEPSAAVPQLPIVKRNQLSVSTAETVHIEASEATHHTVWPQEPPSGYLGQLIPEFQAQLADKWSNVSLNDCYFYHRSRLADGRVVDGAWDLIGGEDLYVGGIELDGRRVLELGPASGWLTLWMEQRGADVVGFDLGWDVAPDLLPLPQVEDMAALRASQVAFLNKFQSTWWYMHHEYNLAAKAVYGSIYHLPRDIGRYDISVFGSILLHLRDPFLALQEVAERTDETIVVAERLGHEPSEVDKSIALWNPMQTTNPNSWWILSPGWVADMLRMLGFSNTTVTFHTQYYAPEVADSQYSEAVLYTVVGRRP